ncbi:MAG: lipopolysaccharide heptosyltransferase II [Candidatus Omnitrophota bacterium]
MCFFNGIFLLKIAISFKNFLLSFKQLAVTVVKDMKKILVVEVNWLGDALLTTPVFKALKKQYPSSYLGVMAVERVREVFEDNPYIDEVIVFDEKGREKTIREKIKFIKFLKKKRFDTVFLIHRSFTRALICFLAGIKNRIGYSRFKNFFILNQRIYPIRSNSLRVDAAPTGWASNGVNESSNLIHRQDRYIYLFEKVGVKIEDKQGQFFVSAQAQKKADFWLEPIRKKHSLLVGINPSANWGLKRWPKEYFVELCRRLIKELNCAVIFIGAKKEKAYIEEILQNIGYQAYNFCGRTSLKELAALIKGSNLFISNDSGPAHLSASLGIKTLVIFGPTSEQVTSPKGKYVKVIKKDVGCQIPCYELNCSDNICMKNVKVDQVYLEAKRILTDEPR